MPHFMQIICADRRNMKFTRPIFNLEKEISKLNIKANVLREKERRQKYDNIQNIKHFGKHHMVNN